MAKNGLQRNGLILINLYNIKSNINYMDLIFDKKFHLITFITVISYIYINQPAHFGFIGKILTHKAFIFLGVFYLYYRITYDVLYSFILSFIIVLILKCMQDYEENFNNQELLKINFYDSDKPLILNNISYSLDDNNKIPDTLLLNIQKITSFDINPNYYITISNKDNYERVYKGEYIVQSLNPFLGVTAINIYQNSDNVKRYSN